MFESIETNLNRYKVRLVKDAGGVLGGRKKERGEREGGEGEREKDIKEVKIALFHSH